MGKEVVAMDPKLMASNELYECTIWFSRKKYFLTLLSCVFQEQNKRLQILLEDEQTPREQRADHYEASLRKFQGDSPANLVMLQSVQAALQDKDTLVQKLQEQLEFIDNVSVTSL